MTTAVFTDEQSPLKIHYDRSHEQLVYRMTHKDYDFYEILHKTSDISNKIECGGYQIIYFRQIRLSLNNSPLLFDFLVSLCDKVKEVHFVQCNLSMKCMFKVLFIFNQLQKITITPPWIFDENNGYMQLQKLMNKHKNSLKSFVISTPNIYDKDVDSILQNSLFPGDNMCPTFEAHLPALEEFVCKAKITDHNICKFGSSVKILKFKNTSISNFILPKNVECIKVQARNNSLYEAISWQNLREIDLRIINENTVSVDLIHKITANKNLLVKLALKTNKPNVINCSFNEIIAIGKNCPNITYLKLNNLHLKANKKSFFIEPFHSNYFQKLINLSLKDVVIDDLGDKIVAGLITGLKRLEKFRFTTQTNAIDNILTYICNRFRQQSEDKFHKFLPFILAPNLKNTYVFELKNVDCKCMFRNKCDFNDTYKYFWGQKNASSFDDFSHIVNVICDSHQCASIIDQVHQIIEGLYISGLNGSINHSHLFDYIIDISNYKPELRPYSNLVFRINDDVTENILQYFEYSSNIIHQQLARKNKILVHCVAGISRSSSLIIAYLIRYKQMSLQESFSLIRSKRSFVKPNESFLKQLALYEFSCLNRN